MTKRTTIVLGTSAVAAWFIVFGLGLLIASKPYRDQVANGLEWRAFFLSLLTYTPTNIAGLCLLAAFCGGCASRLIHAEAISANPTVNPASNAPPSDTEIYRRENPFSSMFRGFVVYVAFLAGVYVTSNAPFLEPTSEQFARAAGATSLLAFVVGYDPTLFQTLIALGAKVK
jgi:hypothetical protein